MAVNLFTLKLLMLTFWASWFSLVFGTNLCAALKALRLLPQSWRFASANYQAITIATARYGAPHWIPVFLFYGVVVWQLLAATFFLIALFASLRGAMLDINAINAAYTVAVAHWMALLLADEIFEEYEKAKSHALFLIVQLSTLIGIHFLPP